MAGTLCVPAIGLSAPGIAAERCATPPSPGVGIRLAEAPTDRKDDPRARLYIIDHVNPGTTITRKIVVANGTDRAVRLQLYPAAAELVDGQFKVIEGRSANDLTSWTTVTPNVSDLSPGECENATVTIAVPARASEGERYGVALAELPAGQAAPGSVGVAARVGVRIYLSVGPGGEPRTDFEITQLTAARQEDGRPVVLATVHNIGGRAIDLSGELMLTEGPSELRAGPFPAKLGTTLGIDETEPVSVILESTVPAGPWLARLTLRSGETERMVEGTITFPDAKGASASPVPVTELGDSATPLVAGSIVAGLVLLGLLVALGIWMLRRRRRADESEIDATRAALVRAREAGSQAALERMALRLHQLQRGPEAMDALLEALRGASGDSADELVDAAAAYGQAALLASPRLAALPVDRAAALGERVAETPRGRRR